VIQPHGFQSDFISQVAQCVVPTSTSALNVPIPGFSSAVNNAAAKGQWISVRFVHLRPSLTTITFFLNQTYRSHSTYPPGTSSHASITPSDAATILLNMSQLPPASHTTAMEQAPTSLPATEDALRSNHTTAAKPRTRNPTKSGNRSAPAPAAKASVDTKARRSQRNQKK
jgi:hypothetical protein